MSAREVHVLASATPLSANFCSFVPSSNYDILAAVFTDVLKNMHDDFGLV